MNQKTIAERIATGLGMDVPVIGLTFVDSPPAGVPQYAQQVPAAVPDFANSPPLGFAAKVSTGGVEGHFVVTTETLRTIGDTVAKTRAAAREKRQQQQEQQQ